MQTFVKWLEVQSNLYNQLLALRPLMVQAAQKVYNEWEQTDECDVGGICDEIAMEIAGVIDIPGVNTTEGGHDGDDHAWTIAYNKIESYGIDIAPSVYETGAGYCWKKIPNVIFDVNDISIWNLGVNPQEFE